MALLQRDEGPYYIAKEKVRKNIVEHKQGTPLALRLTVVDAATCTPINGAAVDVWHCDAAGIYSGFGRASTGDGPGSAPARTPPAGNGGPPPGGAAGRGLGPGGPTDTLTFLRGIQRTDAHGSCAFDTIYPGWYRGRTVHIHIKVHLGGTVIHTGQLFFADSLTDQVYQTGVYKARAAARDTRNSGDAIYARRPRIDAHDDAHHDGGLRRHDHAGGAALLSGRRAAHDDTGRRHSLRSAGGGVSRQRLRLLPTCP